MAKKICFIDDDEKFEIPLFIKTFVDEFDLITAAGFAECLRQIEKRGGWTPDLFVLDMYFPSGAPDTKAIEALTLHPLEIPDDKAEIRQAYINYLAAKDRLNAVLAAWKQGPDGGIRLAAQIRIHYPKVPIAFYSRKATAEDALRCLRQDGVLDVISKPTGRDDPDTERRTQEIKTDLVLRFKDMMDPTKVQHKSDIQRAVRLVSEEVKFFSTIRP